MMKKGIVVLLAVQWIIAVGCSSGEGSGNGEDGGGCGAWCEEACVEVQKCGVAPSASCGADCTAGFGALSCAGLRPSYQFACNDLLFAHQCLSHCATLCARAPECGPFDPLDCTTGCAEQYRQWHQVPVGVGPLVCNPASVAARNCEQLSIEARHYAGIGRGIREGSGTGPVMPPFPDDIGLCGSGGYCSTRSCSFPTSTCGGPCSSNEDCFNHAGLEALCVEGRCDRGAFP